MLLLVTGAMGHVGYEVVRQAAARGHRVVAQYRGTLREDDARAVAGSVTWLKLDPVSYTHLTLPTNSLV